jgi:cytochrome c-type biogenesis protein CcmH/NrfF
MSWLLAGVIVVVVTAVLLRARRRRSVDRIHATHGVDHRAVQRAKRESQERGFSV